MSKKAYPESVLEVLDETLTYPNGVLQAVRVFAESKPWQGSLNERKKKFRKLNQALSATCKIVPPKLVFRQIDGSHSGASHYSKLHHHIVLMGKLSVVTYLHEFAHAMEMDEKDACRWSINLFRRFFPRQYGKLIHVGHMLVRPTDVAEHTQKRRAS